MLSSSLFISLREPALLLLKLARSCEQRRCIIVLSPQVTFRKPQLDEYVCLLEKQKGAGDSCTYVRILQACSKLKALAEGRRVHAHMIRTGMQLDRVLSNHIVNMYAKCGSAEEARAVFEQMPQANVFSWTAVITAYAQCGHSREALRLFQAMQLDGVRPDRVVFITVLEAFSSPELLPSGRVIHELVLESGMQLDVVAANALVNMYGKCGSPELAQSTFEQMKDKSVITWTTVIAANSQNGRHFEALHLFWQMQLDGVRANVVTLVAVSESCDSPRYLKQGKLVEQCLQETGPDMVAETALVDMYGKCGSLEDARRTLNTMTHRNVVSYSAMIIAYADHGFSEEAFQLYFSMQLDGVQPDCVTLAMLLDACKDPELLTRELSRHYVWRVRGC